MKIEQINPYDINAYVNNTKTHNLKQIKNVAESIRQFGFAQPIAIDNENTVIIGHCRLYAARRLKMKTVPCVRMEDLTEEQAKKLRILDNKLNESEWDNDLLAQELPELDFSQFDIDWGIIDSQYKKDYGHDKAGALTSRFIVPPFSVIDTRQSYWKDRREYWEEQVAEIGDIDPVMIEIVHKWFAPEQCITSDIFAEDKSFELITNILGNKYSGGETDLLFGYIKKSTKYTEEDIRNAVDKVRWNRFIVFLIDNFHDSNTGVQIDRTRELKKILKDKALLNEIIIIQPEGDEITERRETLRANIIHKSMLVFFNGNPKDISSIFKQIN